MEAEEAEKVFGAAIFIERMLYFTDKLERVSRTVDVISFGNHYKGDMERWKKHETKYCYLTATQPSLLLIIDLNMCSKIEYVIGFSRFFSDSDQKGEINFASNRSRCATGGDVMTGKENEDTHRLVHVLSTGEQLFAEKRSKTVAGFEIAPAAQIRNFFHIRVTYIEKVWKKDAFLMGEDERILTETIWGILMSFDIIVRKLYNGVIDKVAMTWTIQQHLFEKVGLSA